MKLGDVVEQEELEVNTQLTQPDSLINLINTLQNFDLEDLQMTTFVDLRFIAEVSLILHARAQHLHDKRLKRTLQ